MSLRARTATVITLLLAAVTMSAEIALARPPAAAAKPGARAAASQPSPAPRAAASQPSSVPRGPSSQPSPGAGDLAAPPAPVSDRVWIYEIVASAGDTVRRLPEERATSTVARSDLDERLPRSAPDAVRYEPGVFVQQTAHGQGSAYLRGLTGQQTLLLFDGLRLNNSTYRQGPNQYLFTLDSQTIAAIDVLRGGGSTRFGSDALGGVILTRPLEPRFASGDGFEAHSRLVARATTADKEAGGRAEVEVAKGDRVAFLGGVGGRSVGRLESAGAVHNPADGQIPPVPRFAPDGRTQLGTGFEELTGDTRLVLRLGSAHLLTLAAYFYRQYDAPRTDQCPPFGARYDECLTYLEQFRTLAYAAWDTRPALGAMSDARVTLSWQRQHEKRRNSRPASYVESLGTDDVDSIGVTARAATTAHRPRPWLGLRLSYGIDTYLDLVGSRASIGFTDIAVVREQSRGQYLDGARYLYGGAFLDGRATLGRRLTLFAGGRASWIEARAPGDPQSGSLPIERSWFPVVGHAGAEWRPRPPFAVLVNVDHSFRAPNLDDLTSRQQTGPGFQFENPALRPERATTFEAGVRLRTSPIDADLWAFETLLTDAVGKRLVTSADCPPETPQCASSWSRYQLANASGFAELRGLEASLRLRLPRGFTVRATVAYTWGEGPNLAAPPTDPAVPYERRVPLSRVPPLNGSCEAQWRHAVGFTAGAVLRWATLQDRLAIADRSDARIPLGGTPGFAVVDLRAAFRYQRRMAFAVVLENFFDARYRYHGSSVNGAGRGLLLTWEATPF